MVNYLIDIKTDYWSIDSSGKKFNFSFEFIPDGYFRDTIKEITYKTLTIGNKAVSTQHRYNYFLKHFFNFLEETKVEIKTFEDFDYELAELFVFYLLDSGKAASTRAVCVAAIKNILDYGVFFKTPGFPRHTVFDGTEFRLLQTQDTLKTMVIDDDELEKIDNVLKLPFKNQGFPTRSNDRIGYLLPPLVAIIRHTGIRISEALVLKKDCLQPDILGKNLLEVISPKNLTERYIPVNNKVKAAVQYLLNEQEKRGLSELAESLFSYLSGRDVAQLGQSDARSKLDIWLSMHQLDPAITFHSFRHTLGTELLNNEMSPFEVMQYLGHESMHSTRLYAKVRNDKLTAEYKKLGFIGLIKESIEDLKDSSGENLNQQTKLVIQLPDGACGKPLEKEVPNCKKPNACLFCRKFITTPEYLAVHEDHLKRIRADKEKYMAEDLFGNEHILNQTEKALETIISRLKALEGGEIVG
ncbi:tyrosine-type recombinase/integrase [Lysinibacillus sp. JNUCC 51]|uniref:tyrosine-type recombinase/integrase n=1 Tax=Lysinibacillus sp. JNUCC-51 TaxID=2792479 RepID=UPI001934E23A|nr:tyrosine-type recombinase/integrase [Lysinibacillus sp. JNUCC-51]